ncbi:alcohol dehydrogenase catalytic domain-containing protein [Mucilaginibacter aquaedulcis]|uniref:alcohol dehydrogenase catalytic domain-containing protein n=1 Tax=Mucilaginibacter aquaedulcis TaxID=1187081 RepID=UPI00338F89DC
MITAKGYAAQSANETLAPWNFERRDVGPHDVQIEIQYCGVCHSDLAQINNEWFPGIFPMVPGQEIVGRISQVGAQVKNFKIGDLAGIGTLVNSCGKCSHREQGCAGFAGRFQ